MLPLLQYLRFQMAVESTEYSDVKCGKHALDVMRLLCFCLYVTSGFPHKVVGNCVLLGYYAASSDNSLTTFQDHLLVPSSGFLTHEDGTDGLS